MKVEDVRLDPRSGSEPGGPPRPPAPPPPRSRRAGGTGITALEGRIRALQGLSRALEGRIVALHGPSMALQGGRERAGGTGRAPSGPPRKKKKKKKKKKTDPGPTGPPHWRRGRPVRQLPGGAGPRRHWAWRLTAAQRGHGVGGGGRPPPPLPPSPLLPPSGAKCTRVLRAPPPSSSPGGRVGRGRARWAWATCRAVSGARRPRRVGGGGRGGWGAPRAGWGGARGALGPPAVQRDSSAIFRGPLIGPPPFPFAALPARPRRVERAAAPRPPPAQDIPRSSEGSAWARPSTGSQSRGSVSCGSGTRAAKERGAGGAGGAEGPPWGATRARSAA